ncbi:hypothetical protein HPO96_02745 [Kribbella sandramycini]|uniref:Cellulase (Glycosyl hydrolase family 5) n=1 Tax=Kribbella sandramycini TaxID=60450 RepID=A0A7Y4NYH4_9ACTN|nr:hypothetical protein [Kribbella sandramycini]MBB6568252.1 hypothetical protein [Kribbella sandramycini]NOL39155.1 hypothetical protein [Kribbella sandramycini]
MLTCRRLLTLVTALLLTVSTLTAGATEVTTATQRGGSNFTWFRLDGCDREPYSTIEAFDRSAPEIRAALKTLYDGGQRRLRIGIFHRRGNAPGGTTMDSTGGDLSPRNRANLTSYLAAVEQAGFAEVAVAFHPIGENDPHTWSSFSASHYAENRDLIANLRPLIAAAGLPYTIDLLNEGLPMTTQPVLQDYSTRLWADYTARFGKNDTVGFSMTVWIANRVETMAEVYGGNLPNVFDVHLYGDDEGNGDEYEQFVAAHRAMAERGYHQGWIIGEAHYADAAAAANIRRAMAETGRTVFYLTQWPWTRQKRCRDVDVAPPTDFRVYAEQGF